MERPNLERSARGMASRYSKRSRARRKERGLTFQRCWSKDRIKGAKTSKDNDPEACDAQVDIEPLSVEVEDCIWRFVR
jgi:hypothetical protein